MTWSSVFAAFKTSLWLTPLLMCVIFCGLLLFVGVKEYGWMVLVKVAAIVVVMAVVAAAIQLFVNWVIVWGVK